MSQKAQMALKTAVERKRAAEDAMATALMLGNPALGTDAAVTAAQTVVDEIMGAIYARQQFNALVNSETNGVS